MWCMKLYVMFISVCNSSAAAEVSSSFKIVFPKIEIVATSSPMPSSCRCESIASCPLTTGLNLRIVNLSTSVACPLGQIWCCQDKSKLTTSSCGRRKFTDELISLPDTVHYGNHSWQVALLMQDNIYFGSGALINANHVLTVAHKVAPYPNFKFKLRIGDWNLKRAIEPFQPQDYDPLRVFIHPNYNSQNMANDIAVIRFNKNISLATSPYINTVCLPNEAPVVGSRCYVAGWGANAFRSTGMYEDILKEVDLPIIDETNCENHLRATRLGALFNLDPISFLCAGGEPGKDSCTGDGGAPLVCSSDNDLWHVAGLVSWGIGCANSTVPGVYINVYNYLSWINRQLTAA